MSYCFATEGSVLESTSLRLRLSGILTALLVEKGLVLLNGQLAGAFKKDVLCWKVERVRGEQTERRRTLAVDMLAGYIRCEHSDWETESEYLRRVRRVLQL